MDKGAARFEEIVIRVKPYGAGWKVRATPGDVEVVGGGLFDVVARAAELARYYPVDVPPEKSAVPTRTINVMRQMLDALKDN